MPSIAILCPLEIERDAIARTLAIVRARSPDALPPESAVELILCGPGSANARFSVERLAERAATPQLVVLAGLAGGLRNTSAAPPIATVIDLDGSRWTCPAMPAMDAGRPGATVVGVESPVITIAEKRSLWEKTSADLVDCESHAFAAACRGAGLRWAVVRGVSDGPNDALPAPVLRWVDPHGKQIPGAAAKDILRSPGLLLPVISLARRTGRALRAAGTELSRLLREERVRMEVLDRRTFDARS